MLLLKVRLLTPFWVSGENIIYLTWPFHFGELRDTLRDLYAMIQMAESIAFFNFCHERSVPYRQCDFFDELVARFASNPQDLRPAKLFSWGNIQELTEDLYHQVGVVSSIGVATPPIAPPPPPPLPWKCWSVCLTTSSMRACASHVTYTLDMCDMHVLRNLR